MPSAAPKSFSRRRYALRWLSILTAANLMTVVEHRGVIGLYLDAFVAGLLALAWIATRLWPDKIWFRPDSD